MNLKNFVEGLTNSEREELFDILTNSLNTATTMPPHIVKEFEEKPQRVQEDFTMHKDKPSSIKGQSRKQPVRARENTWTDTGEYREVETPETKRTPRNRLPPQKKEVTCHVCGKNSKVNANIVYGEYYRCDRCTGR